MINGDQTDDIEEKLEILASYYALMQVPEGSILEVLERISIPSLEDGHVQALDADITLVKVQDAIKALKSNTALGPDGLTIEFYKTFTVQL